MFTAILKERGYIVDLFNCTPYLATHEFLKEPLPVTKANSLLNSRQINAQALFSSPKTVLLGDFANKLNDYKPHAIVFSTVCEDTWPQVKELVGVISAYLEIKTIIGGVYATMAGADMISHPGVYCVGEGGTECRL